MRTLALLVLCGFSCTNFDLQAADPPSLNRPLLPDPRPWIAEAEPLVVGVPDDKERIRILALLGAANYAVGEQAASEKFFGAALDAARALPDDWRNTYSFVAVAHYRNAVGQKGPAVDALKEGIKNTRNWLGRANSTTAALGWVMDEAALAGDFELVHEAADVDPQTKKSGYRALGMTVRTLRRHGRRDDALRLLEEFERGVTAAGVKLTSDATVNGYFIAAELAKLGEKEKASMLLDQPYGPELAHEFLRAEAAAAYLLVGRRDEGMRIIDDLADPYWPIRAFLQAGQVDEALRRIDELPEPAQDERYRRRGAWCACAHLLWTNNRRDEAQRVMRAVLKDEAQSAPDMDEEREADSDRWLASITAHFGLFDEAVNRARPLPPKQRAEGLLEIALEALQKSGGEVLYCPLSVVGLASSME